MEVAKSSEVQLRTLNCVRSTACCIKRYFVGWLSVVACWLNQHGYRLVLGLGLGPGNGLAILFSPSGYYKCGEHLSSRGKCSRRVTYEYSIGEWGPRSKCRALLV